MNRYATLLTGILALQSLSAFADHHMEGEHQQAVNSSVTMYSLNEKGSGSSIGTIEISQMDEGVVLTPNLKGLTPGLHGFHVHENGSCAPATKDGTVTPGGAAGSHLDLRNSKHHDAPWADGHTGDMPALFVDSSGLATHPVFAPNLNLKMMDGKAVIIHEGGDNYSDSPKPLGGGGARVACGIVGGK